MSSREEARLEAQWIQDVRRRTAVDCWRMCRHNPRKRGQTGWMTRMRAGSGRSVRSNSTRMIPVRLRSINVGSMPGRVFVLCPPHLSFAQVLFCTRLGLCSMTSAVGPRPLTPGIGTGISAIKVQDRRAAQSQLPVSNDEADATVEW